MCERERGIDAGRPALCVCLCVCERESTRERKSERERAREREREYVGKTRVGVKPSKESLMALMCSGVVPQHPPIMFTSPSLAHACFTRRFARWVADFGFRESGFGFRVSGFGCGIRIRVSGLRPRAQAPSEGRKKRSRTRTTQKLTCCIRSTTPSTLARGHEIGGRK